MKTNIPLILLFLVAGCGPADNEAGPGGATVGEARALDEAAEMIEQRRLPPGAIGEQADAQPSDAADKPAAE